PPNAGSVDMPDTKSAGSVLPGPEKASMFPVDRFVKPGVAYSELGITLKLWSWLTWASKIGRAQMRYLTVPPVVESNPVRTTPICANPPLLVTAGLFLGMLFFLEIL